MPRRMVKSCLVLLLGIFVLSGPAEATILTFEVFDPTLDFPPFNDPLVSPNLPDYGYPEGFRIPTNYGDNVSGSPVPPVPGPLDVVFQYGFGAEGTTPNVAADYGPYSIFTGGPELWREGFGDLDGILYQGSRFGNPPIGTNYNILDIVLYADPGWDVELYGFDLGAFGGSDLTIAAVTVYDGIPFPFLTPTNDIFEQTDVIVDGTTRTPFDFSATPLQSHVIWLRINANNLGDGSENIGIDNIRFGQIENVNSTEFIDPEVINAVLGEAEAVPEPSTFALAALGLLSLGMCGWRRRQR